MDKSQLQNYRGLILGIERQKTVRSKGGGKSA